MNPERRVEELEAQVSYVRAGDRDVLDRLDRIEHALIGLLVDVHAIKRVQADIEILDVDRARIGRLERRLEGIIETHGLWDGS